MLSVSMSAARRQPDRRRQEGERAGHRQDHSGVRHDAHRAGTSGALPRAGEVTRL